MFKNIFWQFLKPHLRPLLRSFQTIFPIINCRPVGIRTWIVGYKGRMLTIWPPRPSFIVGVLSLIVQVVKRIFLMLIKAFNEALALRGHEFESHCPSGFCWGDQCTWGPSPQHYLYTVGGYTTTFLRSFYGHTCCTTIFVSSECTDLATSKAENRTNWSLLNYCSCIADQS